jgi:hypothetical protein
LFACSLAAGRSLCVILFYYGRKHRPCEALNAGADLGKPFSQPGAASACCSCSGIVTATITTTIPSTASAATMAIIAIDVFVVVLLISLSPL